MLMIKATDVTKVFKRKGNFKVVKRRAKPGYWILVDENIMDGERWDHYPNALMRIDQLYEAANGHEDHS